MKEEHFEYLEAYLEGMLSPEEREDVWRQIRRDPQLAEELIIRSTDQAQMGLWAARNAPDLLAIDKIHKDNEDSFKAHPANLTTGNPSLYRTPSPSEKKEGRTPFTFANNCINSIIGNIPRFTKMKPNITHRNFLSNPVFLTGGLVVLLVAGLLFWFADSSEPQEQGDIAYFSRPIEESDEYHKGATIVAFVSGEVSLIEPSRHASNAAAESLGPTKRPAKANDVLPPGCQVHTGANSEVILLFSNGTIATVGANTQMLVEAFVQKEFDGSDKKVGELLEEVSPSRMKLNLDLGELIVDVRKLNRQSSLIIPASVGTAGIRGTQFMVTANEDAAAVSVLTGLVDFLDVDKAVYHIAKEARLEANKETAPKRLAIPITVKERIEAAIQIARQKTGHLSVADLAKAFGEVSSRGVFIADETLRAAMLKELRLKTEDRYSELSVRTIASIEKLKLSGKRLTDLTGLEYATNLSELDLYHNQISDLTPLAKLTELTELTLHFNQVADVTPLGKLTNLVSLGLQTNQITDVTPLAELTNLKTLWISNNHFITDDQKEMLKKALPNCEISF